MIIESLLLAHFRRTSSIKFLVYKHDAFFINRDEKNSSPSNKENTRQKSINYNFNALKIHLQCVLQPPVKIFFLDLK